MSTQDISDEIGQIGMQNNEYLIPQALKNTAHFGGNIPHDANVLKTVMVLE